MTLLSVNVNKIALLRNSRAGKGPDVVPLARVALEAGAAGITVHPRPDQRHITKADVSEIARLLAEPAWEKRKEEGGKRKQPDSEKTGFSPPSALRPPPSAFAREFNIEGNPFEGEWMDIVGRALPHQATLVPDAPGQSTSDHGFEMPADVERLRPVVARLKELGCRASLFMDPSPEAMRHAAAAGADRVELYTESYADAFARRDVDRGHFEQTLGRFVDSANAAADAGLGVNAGHDLNLANLPEFVAALGPDVLLEVSIGHALIGDALHFGMAEAVRRYLAAIRGGAAMKNPEPGGRRARGCSHG